MLPDYSKYDLLRSDFIFTDLKKQFREIDISELFSIWDDISDFVKRAVKFSPEDICSADVYMKLMGDNSYKLFVLEHSGIFCGIIVAHIINGRANRTMHVWLASGNDDSFDDIGKAIYNIAKRNKCSNITASSTRKGMQKALSSFGFKEKFVSYEMSLS